MTDKIIDKNIKIKKQLLEKGYIPKFDYIHRISLDNVTIQDKDGYLYFGRIYKLLRDDKKPRKFDKNNIYTIDNINLYLSLNGKSDYLCISVMSEYTRNDCELKFLHKPCNTVFIASLVEMQGKVSEKNKYYKQCPNCKNTKTESTHASVLKQIFLHEYPSTSIEDTSCINPKTNRPLPTDIVNHDLRIAIEVQSRYHDLDEQKEKDKIKKEFWINKGYQFYNPDIRDYSILEMCKLFFNTLNEIPDYINYNFSNCIDYVEVQNYLNDGYSIKEISEIINAKEGTVRHLIFTKKVTLPIDYKDKILHQKPIIRLSKTGEFIKRYINLSSVKEDNFASGTIIRVLKGKQKYSYDSLWVYEKDYLCGKYIIPSIKKNKFDIPVKQYDMGNNFICEYKNIEEASNITGLPKSDIYRVAIKHERKSCGGYKFEQTN